MIGKQEQEACHKDNELENLHHELERLRWQVHESELAVEELRRRSDKAKTL